MIEKKTILFSTRRYSYLAQKVLQLGDFEAGIVERKEFADGELYQRVCCECRNRNVVIIGGTASDSDTLELYDLASALAKYGAQSLIIVIPYFGYSTMERAVRPGEIVTAKTRARLLSTIPLAATGNRIVFIDLHSDGMQYYLEGPVLPVHLSAAECIKDVVQERYGRGFVVCCTDAGRAKWIQHLANIMGVPAGFIQKRRREGAKPEVLVVSASVEDRRVVLYDDMVRTGGSLLRAAEAYLEEGAQEVVAVCTHAVFTSSALSEIHKSGLIKRMHCFDTHPRVLEINDDFVETHTVAPLITQYIESAYS